MVLQLAQCFCFVFAAKSRSSFNIPANVLFVPRIRELDWLVPDLYCRSRYGMWWSVYMKALLPTCKCFTDHIARAHSEQQKSQGVSLGGSLESLAHLVLHPWEQI